MNLDKLIGMQKGLDSRIREEKGLQDADLVTNTYVALQVELAEFANEARWFKHWSENQEPRTEYICKLCEGSKEISREIEVGGPEMGFDVHEVSVNCPACEDVDDYSNPLLEEFADGVHFFLSLAIQRDWEDALYIPKHHLNPDEFDGDLSGWYLEMVYCLNKSFNRVYTEESAKFLTNSLKMHPNMYDFEIAWTSFLNIGMNGFGFTWEQIEQAYIDKNKINHERQENSY